jgi:Mn2+/Fe2+ NRAMP family transporter
MIPEVPLITIMFLSQTVNGILLPIVLIIMLRLVNDREVMEDHVNSRRMNAITWITVVLIILLTGLLLVTSITTG